MKGLEQAYKPIHPSKGLLQAFHLMPGWTQSAFNYSMWTRWRAQQFGLVQKKKKKNWICCGTRTLLWG
jgi:hypothetical protein